METGPLGTSHVTTKQRCQYTTSMDIQNAEWQQADHMKLHYTLTYSRDGRGNCLQL